MSVYSENFQGTKVGIIPELLGVLTNPTDPQKWMQLAFHVWDTAQLVIYTHQAFQQWSAAFDYLWRMLHDSRNWTPQMAKEKAFTELGKLMPDEITKQCTLISLGEKFPMSASILRLSWNLCQYLQLYDIWKSVAVTIPSEYGILIPAERYWRRFYARARPSFRDSFIMWKKGLVPKDLPKSILTEDIGLSEELAEKFLDHAHYDPSPSELARLNRTTPLADEYIKKKLIENGLDDEDIRVFYEWIKKEPVKDELLRVSSILVSEYAEGTIGMKTLEEFHMRWKFSSDEIALRKAVAEILRARYVQKLLRDAEIYLYRRDKITEDELFERLKALGISEDVANAIARLEAARKGIEWKK